MGIINDINSLTAPTMIKCNQFISECAKEGITVAINETWRSPETQLLYYLQGRLDYTNPIIEKELNSMRKLYKFWEISSNEMKNKITFTLNSVHLTGNAFDAVPLDDVGKMWWNAPQAIWDKMGICGEKVGLKWGGRWKNKDSPHFENNNV